MSAAAAERSLFAAKGRAAAVGSGPVETVAVEPRSPESVPQALADAASADAGPATPAAARPDGDEAQGAAAAGSLLAFQLRGGPGRSALGDSLKAALAEKPAAAEKPVAAPAAAPLPPPSPAAAAPAADPIMPPPPARQVAETRPAATAGRSAARLDRPVYPRPRAERDASLAMPPLAAAEAPRASGWRIAVPLAVVVAAISAVGWLVSSAESPALPEAEPVVAADAGSPMQEPAAAPGPDLAAGMADQPVPEASTLATTPPAPSAATLSPTPEPVPAAMPLPPDAPSFEVVRTAAGAPPVLAGRASPGSRLIVLDNGAVLGTATADANGEWALVSDAPLPAGRHEFTLALATPDGAVVVEQAETAPSAPPAGEASGDGLPVPGQKPPSDPAALDAVARRYVVQLASVPSEADAAREWARLQLAYPSELGGAAVDIDSVELGGRGTFYRVRTGAFADRDAARRLCAALNGAGQECLVVRQAAE